MYREDELLPISALQHYLFCPRQCALIHLEQVWAENILTAEGRLLHDRVHSGDTENRVGIRTVFAVKLRSLQLGLCGQADMVEFRRSEQGVRFSELNGCWQPYPVEYKHGKPKLEPCDEVQLCAQAVCIEEMLNIEVPQGAIFYGTPRRRTEVRFTETLRQLTTQTAKEVHALLKRQRTPAGHYEKKCKKCSLYDLCLPRATGPKKNIAAYISKAFDTPL